MGDNLKIRKLKADLVKILNECLLPVEVKRMIVNDIQGELTRLAEEVIAKEQEELNEKESESNGISSDN